MDIKFSKQAIKTISKMDSVMKKRIRQGVENLPSGDIKQLQGYDNSLRLRVGKYRIIYRQISETEINVDKIDSRGDIYK